MFLGWANYLTLYSKESNLTSENLPRINVNADDLEQLYDDLKSSFNDEWANYIIHYRTSESAPTTEAPDEEAGNTRVNAATVPPDFETITSQRKFDTVLELMDTFVVVDDPENLNAFAESPVRFLNMGLTIPTMMASLTTYEGQ